MGLLYKIKEKISIEIKECVVIVEKNRITHHTGLSTTKTNTAELQNKALDTTVFSNIFFSVLFAKLFFIFLYMWFIFQIFHKIHFPARFFPRIWLICVLFVTLSGNKFGFYGF